MKNIAESFKELKWYENIMFAAMVVIGAYYMIVDTKHPQWYLIINYICSACGVCCIFLTAHANLYNWLFAIVNTVLYCIILWYNKVYGTFALETFYYMPTNIIGLMAWLRHLDNDGSSHCKARRLTYKEIAYMLVFLGIGTLICHEILVRLGRATAWLDSMAVSIGIIATVYEIKRFGEQYILLDVLFDDDRKQLGVDFLMPRNIKNVGNSRDNGVRGQITINALNHNNILFCLEHAQEFPVNESTI